MRRSVKHDQLERVRSMTQRPLNLSRQLTGAHTHELWSTVEAHDFDSAIVVSYHA